MAYSENFPAQRPSFMFDASNAGRIPPNMTFTRASTANVWDGSKHLSSDNLLLQSSSFDTTWTTQGLTSLTGGQTDPSGALTGLRLLKIQQQVITESTSQSLLQANLLSWCMQSENQEHGF